MLFHNIRKPLGIKCTALFSVLLSGNGEVVVLGYSAIQYQGCAHAGRVPDGAM